jgi:alkanesulfonate monooxygenase SsuD/methylene tetrahydromethanopterin reductase-like flavin-dependent oxidoreductase (luciferase family)
MGCWEFWSILCAIVACTSRVELGTLAMGMGFRNPALLAKMADTLDESATADESSALWWKDMPFSDDVGQVEPLPGAPEDIAATLKEFADLGVDHIQFQLDSCTVENIEKLAPVLEAFR